jgi:glycosyltransferase involved in cell wall biosynthesis
LLNACAFSVLRHSYYLLEIVRLVSKLKTGRIIISSRSFLGDDKLKVLFNTYVMANQQPGGGEKIILKLKEYLEKHEDVTVTLFNPWQDKISDYDIVHHFSTLDFQLWFTYKNDFKKPLVVTPTQWPSSSGIAKLKYQLKYQLKHIFQKYPQDIKDAYKLADLILPTTEVEKERIRNFYDVDLHKMEVLPNGVELPEPSVGGNSFVEKFGHKDYLLFIGNIAPVKNLLSLIRVANKQKAQLVVIGEEKKEYADYCKRCRDEAGETIHFIGSLPFESKILSDAYMAARAVIVPSLFETCSLVGLEAGVRGVPLAITQNGGTKEVYKNFVTFLDPDSEQSIETAIMEVTNKSGDDLKQFISVNYSWANISEKLLEAYKSLLK